MILFRTYGIILFAIIFGRCHAADLKPVFSFDSRASVSFPGVTDTVHSGPRTSYKASVDGITYTATKTILKEGDPTWSYHWLAYNGFSELLKANSNITILKDSIMDRQELYTHLYLYSTKQAGADSTCSIAQAFYYDGTLYTISCTGKSFAQLQHGEPINFISSLKILKQPQLSAQSPFNCATDIDFTAGHIIFGAVFGAIAFILYYIWKKNGAPAWV